jgi:hypothetical protein
MGVKILIYVIALCVIFWLFCSNQSRAGGGTSRKLQKRKQRKVNPDESEDERYSERGAE